MTGSDNILLKTTLEYGQGHSRMIDMAKHNETATVNHDCVGDMGEKFLDYHIYQIYYHLRSNECIQSLKMIFKNRNTGQLETLLDTDPEDDKSDKFQFEDNEEITEVRVWLKKESLIGFELTTNKNRSKKIGFGDDNTIKIKEFEKGDKIIFGFGCQANKQYGVCSFYCYFMDKRMYGIVLNQGLIQLRSKLKKNEAYRKEVETKKATLNEKQSLILETCDLPDTAFFPIVSYIMSY